MRKPEWPSGDHVRVRPGERKGALPERSADDDDRLLGLLKQASREVQGLRAIHFHISLLKDKDPFYLNLIREAFHQIQASAAFMQQFSMSNSDVIVLYKGLKFSTISEVCQKIERFLLNKTRMGAQNPYKEDSFFSILELSLRYNDLLRFVEGLKIVDDAMPTELAKTKPPITLEAMARLEKSISMVDFSPFLLNQPVMDADIDGADPALYYELYMSVKQIEERLSPDFDIAGNRWLFQYFTSSLDVSMLRVLGNQLEMARGKKVGININLPTVLSATFVKFDERITADVRGNIVLELQLSDVLANEAMYPEVLEFARARNYKICIDGMTPFSVANFNLALLQADYAKVFWTEDAANLDPAESAAFARGLKEAHPTRFILARCGTVAGLVFAKRFGLRCVQGRMVDSVLRKGLKLRDAIESARAVEA
ncbi:MAG TPA: hypothetical protein VEY95_01395 [Azospirillaceae bacterium]|nr:hypothetical protein [Azospirillaceae bacterium]